jgi:tetratricopeptide (TPR) repeat protein
MTFFSSRALLVEYFADQVIYFIEKGDKRDLVEESYVLFAMFNQDPASSKPYEQIGDAFMAIGDGSRAVLEYRRGLNLEPTWNEVRNKVVRHYLTLGQKHLDSQPRLWDYDPLKEALAAYETLLEVDPSHPLGNQKREETELAIAEREVRYNRNIELVGKARDVARAADGLGRDGKPVLAIGQYKNAIALFNSVSSEFSQPYADAEQGSGSTELLITTIFENAISSGDALIALAQQRELEGNWASAIQSYDGVPESLHLFRNEQFKEEYSTHYGDAERLTASAASKKQQAQTALEQQQAAQQQP